MVDQPMLFSSPTVAAPDPPPVVKKKPQQFTVRPYQQECIDNTFSSWEEEESCLAVLATGCGKTVICGFTADRIIEDGNNYLFLAHRKGLVEQAFESMRAINPGINVGMEMGDNFANLNPSRGCRIVVASKDSMHERRLKRYPRDYFAAIDIDEAHHCVDGKKSYTDVIDHFRPVKLRGMTATPDRADEVALGSIFKTVCYEYGILRAINDGWLVPIVQQLEIVEGFDLSDVDETSRGDLNEAQLANEVRKKPMLHATATAAVKYSMLNGERRPTLIFSASVEHAEEVADILNQWHAKEGSGKAATINSTKMTSDEAKGVMDRFRQGEFQYLANFGIATEGTDLPGVRVVIIARMTKSRSLYAQMVGRVIRPLSSLVPELNAARTIEERKALIAGSRKPGGLIVDLVGNSGQHKLITTLDILGGRFPDEVVEAAKDEILNQGGRASTEGMQAKMEYFAEVEKQKRKAVLKAKLSSRTIDPFDVTDTASVREPGWFKGKKPTDRMKAMLLKNKVPDREVEEMSFFKAKLMIDKIIDRSKKGLCTLPMAKILTKHGFNPDMSFADAKRTIDAIASSGWKLRGDQ